MIDAIVHLKTGEKKVGVLLNQPASGQGYFEFISNTLLDKYTGSCESTLVEVMTSDLIEVIETDLK